MISLEERRRDLIASDPDLYQYVRHTEAAAVLDPAGDAASRRGQSSIAEGLWATARLHREAARRLDPDASTGGPRSTGASMIYSVDGVDGRVTVLVRGEIAILHVGERTVFSADQLMARQLIGEPIELTLEQLSHLGQLLQAILNPDAVT